MLLFSNFKRFGFWLILLKNSCQKCRVFFGFFINLPGDLNLFPSVAYCKQIKEFFVSFINLQSFETLGFLTQNFIFFFFIIVYLCLQSLNMFWYSFYILLNLIWLSLQILLKLFIFVFVFLESLSPLVQLFFFHNNVFL